MEFILKQKVIDYRNNIKKHKKYLEKYKQTNFIFYLWISKYYERKIINIDKSVPRFTGGGGNYTPNFLLNYFKLLK